MCTNYSKITEFYLADDIIQGEEIPFYLLWKGEDPMKICFEFEGFKSIIELYNNISSKTIIEGNKIIISGFHVSGYVGGLLSTEIANKPFTSGSLTIKIVNKKGVIENLKEVRKFYSTSAKIKSLPNIIDLTNLEINNKIDIEFNGNTTVIISIEEMEENECNIDIPSNVKKAIEKMTKILQKELNRLKERFPDHIDAINLFLKEPNEKTSLTKYIEYVEENLKLSLEDEIFTDALVNVFLNAYFKQDIIRDFILRPIDEYFSEFSIDKVYFSNPLLHITVPQKQCLLAIRVVITNLLDQESSLPLEIKLPIKGDIKSSTIPLKDLFSLRRVQIDNN